MVSTCDICCDPFTKRRTPVRCSPCDASTCGATACSLCYMKYLEEKQDAPACMFCKEAFDLGAFTSQCPNAWTSKRIVPLLKKVDRTSVMADLTAQPDLLENYKHYASIKETHRGTKRRLKDLAHETKQLRNSVEASRLLLDAYEDANFHINLRDVDPNDTAHGTSLFRYRCFEASCPGILSDYTCSACKTAFCKDCHQPDGEDHVCKEEDKATVQALASVKPCPSCGEGLSKIDGCDQFFCTACKSGFNWRTGHVRKNLNGYDNPHFFEWRRQVNDGEAERQVGDVVVLPGSRSVTSRLYDLRQMYNVDTQRVKYKFLEDLQMYVIDVQHHLEVCHRVLEKNEKTRNTKRLEYATGVLEESDFESILWRLKISDAEVRDSIRIVEPFGTQLVEALAPISKETLVECLAKAINVVLSWNDVTSGLHPVTHKRFPKKDFYRGRAIKYVCSRICVFDTPITTERMEELMEQCRSSSVSSGWNGW